MIKNDIQLLALDLDGTVLRCDNTLAEEVKAALIAAVNSGIEVVVASGRPFASMPREIMAIEGIHYIVASNGAAIYDTSRRRVRSLTMRESDILRLLALTETHDLIWEAFCEGEICTDRRYFDDPVRYGCSAAYVDYVRASRGCCDDMRGFIYHHRHELDSVEIVCADASVREPLRAELEAALPGLYITSSSADFVEFMDSRATKSSAIQWICQREGIDLLHTAACGNADNDADMLAQAGLGAAVQNASPLCREAADIILPSNDDHGVKTLIDRIIGNTA